MSQVPAFGMLLEDAMMTQRSVRRVKPDPVDDALVLRLIQLALKAPSQQNSQAWEFIVVKDAEVKAKLGRQNRRMWRLYRHVAAWKARNNPKEQRTNVAVEWGVDHFEEIPVFVVACIRGARLAFPPVVAASTFGSIFP
jgi:nitroreductase